MKKIIILIGLFALIGMGIAGYVYIQKNKISSSLSTPEFTAVTSTPIPTISLPPKEQQQQVIVNDQKTHEPLTLAIISPADKSTVKSATLVVKGKTSPKAEVFVNDSEGIADENGNFSLTITLDEGDNPVIVMANDAEGNVAEQDLNIIYDAGQ